MPYSDEQKLIAKALVGGPRTLERLAKETGVGEKGVKKALAGLKKLKVVTESEGTYTIKPEVAEGVMKRREVASEDRFKLRLRIVIEAQAIEKELLERELKKMETALRTEQDFTIYDCVLAKMVKQGEHYSSFLEVNLSVRDFSALIHLMVFYGPTSIEVIKPDKWEIGADALQDGLVELADTIQSYTHVLAQKMNREELAQFQKKIFG